MSTAEPSARAPGAALRTVRRHRGLPNRRALVGSLLVTLAAVGTFATYADADPAPDDPVLVLRRAVVAGQRLTADDVRVASVELPDDLHAQVLQDPASIDGAVAVAALAGGELVQRSAVLPPDEVDPAAAATFEFSLPLESARALDGRLVPGDLVDVLATYGTADAAYTTVVARRARLVEITDGSTGLTSDGLLVLHLALPSAGDVLAAAHASTVATVTVVRSTRAAEVPLPDRYPPDATTATDG